MIEVTYYIFWKILNWYFHVFDEKISIDKKLPCKMQHIIYSIS